MVSLAVATRLSKKFWCWEYTVSGPVVFLHGRYTVAIRRCSPPLPICRVHTHRPKREGSRPEATIRCAAWLIDNIAAPPTCQSESGRSL
eukprot:scaffold9742_cov58-Attheya_sp.AAC.4